MSITMAVKVPHFLMSNPPRLPGILACAMMLDECMFAVAIAEALSRIAGCVFGTILQWARQDSLFLSKPETEGFCDLYICVCVFHMCVCVCVVLVCVVMVCLVWVLGALIIGRAPLMLQGQMVDLQALVDSMDNAIQLLRTDGSHYAIKFGRS